MSAGILERICEYVDFPLWSVQASKISSFLHIMFCHLVIIYIRVVVFVHDLLLYKLECSIRMTDAK